MRSALALTASSLTALLLACAAVRAEPASGWVDPPAKADAVRSGVATPKAAETAGELATATQHDAAPDVAERPQAAGPRHRAEGRRDRRRMAVSPEVDTRAPDPRFGGWAVQAQQLTGAYLDSVSAPNGAMLAAAPRFYADTVRFHGRSMSIAALIAEKRRFVQRWPERRYTPREGTMHTACDAAGALCVVRTVLGFSAGNPARGVRSEGLSELSLAVSFAGGRPVIVSETSRVLRRGSAALRAHSAGRDTGSAERRREGGA